jgi:16S rRNA processing protein RimM
MTYNCRILLGKIVKPSGYEGLVTIRLEKEFIENIPEMGSVFVEVEGRPVPFFISSLEYPGGDLLRVKFEGYDTCEKISEFSGCRVFLTSPGKKEPGKKSHGSISGFRVLAADRKTVGNIAEVIQNPGQDLLRIISPQKKEILVPFHEDLILKIDARKKIIIIEIPEGLTDLN